MNWRFWDPGPDPVGHYFGSSYLPPRRMTRTHLRHIGDEMKRLTGADSYHVQLAGNAPREIELAELGELLPTELVFDITASGPGPWGAEHSQGEMALTLSIRRGQPAVLIGSGVDAESVASGLRQYIATLGEPILLRTWRVPAIFFLILAVAVVPVIVLWSVGDLSLWLIPLVLLLLWTVCMVAGPELRQRGVREREMHRAFDIDVRPIEDVRLDREQHRQRRQTGLKYALITGVSLAVVAALLRQVLP